MKSLKSLLTILFVILVNSTIYTTTVDKVMVSGSDYNHDATVKAAFLAGYASYNGTSFNSNNVLIYYEANGIDESLPYANSYGYDVVIRSTTGITTAINYARDYSNIQVFMPAGANTFAYVFGQNVNTCPIISTGAGTTHNQTGYGIEFFSDYSSNASSYANGYIAGQIAFMANYLNISMSDARALSRAAGTNTDPNMFFYDGYGKIDVQEAIEDALPVELVSIEGSYNIENNTVNIEWATATEVNNSGFEIERSNDKEEWTVLSFVNGHGNSSSIKEYNYSDNTVTSGVYYYRLRQIDFDGTFEYSDIIEVNVEVPTKFELEQNYPNPFNPSTSIRFSLTQSSNIRLSVYTILGEEVAVLAQGNFEAGIHTVNFVADNLSSGSYIYRIESEGYSVSKKMMLVK